MIHQKTLTFYKHDTYWQANNGPELPEVLLCAKTFSKLFQLSDAKIIQVRCSKRRQNEESLKLKIAKTYMYRSPGNGKYYSSWLWATRDKNVWLGGAASLGACAIFSDMFPGTEVGSSRHIWLTVWIIQ